MPSWWLLSFSELPTESYPIRRIGAATFFSTFNYRWDNLQKSLADYIEKQIGLTAAAEGSDREEANQQIQRLWRLTTVQLIDNLGSKNLTVVEAATKNLALMRNEDIVRKIIARIEASEDVAFRRYAILALGMMREKRDCLVPDRKTLSDEKSEKMAKTIIVPFLEKLQKSEKDPETLQFIKMALQFLKKPMDTRPRPSDGRQAPKGDRRKRCKGMHGAESLFRAGGFQGQDAIFC